MEKYLHLVKNFLSLSDHGLSHLGSNKISFCLNNLAYLFVNFLSIEFFNGSIDRPYRNIKRK